MIAAVITKAGELLYAPLDQVGEQQATDVEPAGTALGSAYAISVNAPTPSAGCPIVGLNADNDQFVEIVGDDAVALDEPWGNFAAVDPDDYALTQWFKDAHLARVETGWLDFGAPGTLKNYLEILLTFERNSRAYVGIYAESDGGRQHGRFRGLIFPKETVRIPINLLGRRIRVRLVMVLFNDARCLIRDMRVGFALAGND